MRARVIVKETRILIPKLVWFKNHKAVEHHSLIVLLTILAGQIIKPLMLFLCLYFNKKLKIYTFEAFYAIIYALYTSNFIILKGFF